MKTGKIDFRGGEEIMVKEILDAQRQHWEDTCMEKPEMFGAEPSKPARKAAEIFRQKHRADAR
jgi:hypothetical protein